MQGNQLRDGLPGFGTLLAGSESDALQRGAGRMLFTVRHVTAYTYDQPVRLAPHWLRLRPRGSDPIELQQFGLDIDPAPAGRTECVDPDGNRVARVWFAGQTQHLTIVGRFSARTHRRDASQCLDEPSPCDQPYAAPLRARLAPWIDGPAAAPAVQAFAAELRAGVGHAQQFVHRLNVALHTRIRREVREFGAPQAAQETLRLSNGACRDIAVLFVAVCRSQGLAARFVSGYQRGRDVADGEGIAQRRHMHAWPEVYLTGRGWCGFDPTHGTEVTDAHVALAAAAESVDAAPIEGSYFGAAQATLRTTLEIDVCD
jgi:transglutaminase-like putative cysteine protease